VSRPAGLAVGRVVHYAPDPKLDDPSARIQGKILAGRVSEIHADDTVTLHIDVPADPSRKPGRAWHYGMSYVVTEVPHDEQGAPGTWRYPPRVP
jgi:hypothetical protein